MADNYLGKKMEDHQRAIAPARRTSRSLSQLLERNRSHRAFDASFRVREDQLRRIVEVATKVPSARNQQVLRFRMVLEDEAAKVLPHIRLGGALPELHLPTQLEDGTGVDERIFKPRRRAKKRVLRLSDTLYYYNVT